MKVLISNDDGVFAPGLAALVRAFAGAGHEVTVCAPDGQRSAASQSLTIGRPLVVREVEVEGAAKAYAIGGTPADCVKLGLSSLIPQAEAVISGVNHGFNAGSDVLYSGTVGAAMEGALGGLPAMAVSAFDDMIAHPLPPCSVLNINYPVCDEAKGLRAAPMGQLHYDESYVKDVNEAGETTYTLSGSIAKNRRQSRDYELLEQGYATMTVLHYDMTHAGATRSLSEQQ